MTRLGTKGNQRGEGGPVATGHAGMVAVRFHADRADRIAFTHPRNVIIVTPPERFDQLKDQPEPLSLPAAPGQTPPPPPATPLPPLPAPRAPLPADLRASRTHLCTGPGRG